MSESTPTICPWCQSEIVWDPDIGPEKECPNCYNDLGDYRSITLNLDDEPKYSQDVDRDPEDKDWQDTEDMDDIEPDIGPDIYAENVDRCLGTQEEAPECSYCRELMLFSGTYTVGENQFSPIVPAGWTRAFLPAPFQVKLFLCPSCFKTETYLSDNDRLAVIRAFREGSPPS